MGVTIVCLGLTRYKRKMPPTEQQTLPIGEFTLKSIGDLKTVNKAIKFPVVSDTVKKASDVVTQISENAHVETARQYLQDGIKTLSETEAFTNIQGKVKELNENPRVQEVITNINLKDKVERLDTLATDGIESLASAVPSLRAPTPQLVETAKEEESEEAVLDEQKSEDHNTRRCANCFTDKTPTWRRTNDKRQYLCNKCGLKAKRIKNVIG